MICCSGPQVTHTHSGGILSGGQDSKICLWEPKSVRCQDLKGHSAPISALGIDPASGIAMSCSYDKTLRLWSVSKGMAKMSFCQKAIIPLFAYHLRLAQRFKIEVLNGALLDRECLSKYGPGCSLT